MTEPYVHLDRDGEITYITPRPAGAHLDPDTPGAQFRRGDRALVDIDSGTAVPVCRAVLDAAGRDDVRIVEPGQDYVTITYGPWHPSGLVCGDIDPQQDDCEEVVAQRTVTVDYPPGGRHAVVVGMDLGDHSQHTADTAPSALELDRVTRELAEGHRERDQARAERDDYRARLQATDRSWARVAADRDRYRAAWQSARTRAADWRQEAETRHRTVVHECCERAQQHTGPPEETARDDDARREERERCARMAEDDITRLPARIRALGDEEPTPGARDTKSEPAEADEAPTLADRVDTVEDHTDHLGYRLDGLAHEYNRIVELLSTVGDLAGQVADHGGHLETQGSAISSHTRELADLALRVSELGEALSTRIATLETVIRQAATTGDLRTAEDQADDRARRAEERLAAIETRLLALEQRPAEDDRPIVYALRRHIRQGGATDGQ